MSQQRRNVWAAGAALVGAVILNLALTGAAKAATITQTGVFSDIFDGASYTSPGSLPTGFFFAEELVTGVDKFDPAMGTLIGVTVSADFESSLTFDVFADDVIDDSLPHSVDADADFLSAFIGYSPGGGTSTFTLTSADYSPVAFCFGDPFDGPCFDVFFEDMVTSGSDLVSSLSSFDPSDFVGAGPVTALSAIIAIPGDALFSLDNVGSAGANLSAEMRYIDLKVTYEFTPVPEPTTLLLAGLASVGLLAHRRRRA